MIETVVSWVWYIVSGVAVFLLLKYLDHERRIQKIEDVQGSKLDNLAKDLKEFKIEVREKLDSLTAMVHKEKNFENQLNTTLGLILKHLSQDDKD